MGQLLGGKCSCGYKCEDLFEGSGMSRSTGVLAIHYCASCKILFSTKLPELPRQPFNAPKEERERKRQLWQEEVNHLLESPRQCHACGAMSGKIAPLFDYTAGSGFLSKKIFRLKKKIRRVILNWAHLLPRSSSNKIYSKIYWATLFLEQPNCLVNCPQCSKRKIKLYEMGCWD